MERSQSRLLLALAACVALIAAILYFQGQPELEGDPDAVAAVWDLDTERITAVRVVRPGGVLRVEREGEFWYVREPFDALADPGQVHDLVDALGEVRKGIPLEVPDGERAEFGLGEPPSAHVTVTLDDSSTKTLVVGEMSPTGYRTYVLGADGGVVAVDGDPNRPLQLEASRFRDRHVLRFDAARVRRVSIASEQGTLAVQGQGHDWFLDGFGRADPDKVDDLVVGLLEMRFDLSLDEPMTIADPVFEVDITLDDDSVVWLKTGPPSPLDAGLRATTSDGRSGTLWAESVAQLGRGPTDVGWRTALGIDIDTTDRVTVAAPGGAVRVDSNRNGAAWQSAGHDDGVVYDTIAALSAIPLIYDRAPPDNTAAADFEVIVTQGDRAHRLSVGPALPDGHRAVRDEAGGVAVRMPTKAFDDALAAYAAGVKK